MEITSELANKFLRYDPKTGKLFWRERSVDFFCVGNRSSAGTRSQKSAADTWNTRYAGREISTHGNGYVKVRLLGKTYEAHRVIWLMNTGEWPKVIDHINGVRDDNRMENLRSVSSAENSKNLKRYERNSSGATGVRWHKKDKKWHARVTINGRSVHIGCFDNFDDAAAARRASALAHGYHSNHGRISP